MINKHFPQEVASKRYLPSNGGSWAKSPTKTSWIPPNGKSLSRTTLATFSSLSKSVAESILISSKTKVLASFQALTPPERLMRSHNSSTLPSAFWTRAQLCRVCPSNRRAARAVVAQNTVVSAGRQDFSSSIKAVFPVPALPFITVFMPDRIRAIMSDCSAYSVSNCIYK